MSERDSQFVLGFFAGGNLMAAADALSAGRWLQLALNVCALVLCWRAARRSPTPAPGEATEITATWTPCEQHASADDMPARR